MSIDNLYKKCMERKTANRGVIKYGIPTEVPDPKNFDKVKERG